jgi:hypothetical protein
MREIREISNMYPNNIPQCLRRGSQANSKISRNEETIKIIAEIK